jgi:hypothetical protein
MPKRFYHSFLCLILLGGFTYPILGQDQGKKLPYSFAADVGTASKYIWRGQRLTNDWSLQPSGTMSIGNFSVNIWGTLDLAAVNEGDALYIAENPDAPPGSHSGLQGKFSEVDYTFSYTIPVNKAIIDVGSIIYAFPNRAASLPSTTEIYGGVTLDALPLSPSATLYVDVDESRAAGRTGVYFQLAAGHSVPLHHPRFSALEFSGSLSFANSGFSNYYYGTSHSGLHDVNLTLSLPITLGEQWSASPFLSVSALVGDFRDSQFLDPRDVYRGRAGEPASYADTVWGGITLSLAF